MTEIRSLVFATHNAHKAREVEQMLGGDFEIKTLTDIGCLEEIAETEDTLEGNAELKAEYIRQKYKVWCFSEDTGLEVEALGGAPGVNTARYAGEDKNPEANIALLLKNLKGQENRRAQFRTIIHLILPGVTIIMEGVCKGRIATEKRGNGGWGYDPVFIPDGYDKTFAELGEALKNQISHRAKAIAMLKESLIEFNRDQYED